MLSSMPRPAVGSLELSEYVEQPALILSRNGVEAGPDPLAARAEQLAGIALPTATADAEPETPKPLFIAGEGGMTPRGSGTSAADHRSAATCHDWLYHIHNYHGTRCSPLKQINTDNLDQLKEACIYHARLTGIIPHGTDRAALVLAQYAGQGQYDNCRQRCAGDDIGTVQQ